MNVPDWSEKSTTCYSLKRSQSRYIMSAMLANCQQFPRQLLGDCIYRRSLESSTNLANSINSVAKTHRIWQGCSAHCVSMHGFSIFRSEYGLSCLNTNKGKKVPTEIAGNSFFITQHLCTTAPSTYEMTICRRAHDCQQQLHTQL